MEGSKEGEATSSRPLIPPPLPPPPSPSVSSEESSNKKEEAVLAELITVEAPVKRSDQGGDDAVADGYRTPTSPEYRIPVPLECPPAPRKPPPPPSSSSSGWRQSKRKMRSGQADGGDVKEAGFEDDLSLEVEEFSPAAKKARKKSYRFC